VSDCGAGIPEDKIKEVFEPFFTSKAEGMGMGIIYRAHHHGSPQRADIG
jgi:C4-dicarboxylate-specific signal transduction histidine kinase